MKRYLLPAMLCLGLATAGAAQQTPADSPATKEDIERYLKVTHARETMKTIMDLMAHQMHQMVHDEVTKNAANLPPDFEARMNKMSEDMLKEFPLEEMLEATIPVYQKHWTKDDVNAMVAFYSTPTGQKILKELPATMAEAMQAMQPIMQRRMQVMTERVQQEVAQTLRDSKPKSGKKSQATPN
jgi:hypothetical protein